MKLNDITVPPQQHVVDAHITDIQNTLAELTALLSRQLPDHLRQEIRGYADELQKELDQYNS